MAFGVFKCGQCVVAIVYAYGEAQEKAKEGGDLCRVGEEVGCFVEGGVKDEVVLALCDAPQPYLGART